MKANDSLKPAEQFLAPPSDEASNRDFFKVVVGSTALGLGCLAAAVESLRSGVGGFAFHVSAWTWVAFVAGFAATLLYWKMAARRLLTARIGTAILVLAGISGFLYPLRFVPADKMSDIAFGLGTAVCALSTGACLLWRMKRFFDADDAGLAAKRVN